MSMQIEHVEELYDIYGMVHIPFWQTTTFLVSIIGVIIVIGLIAAYVVFRMLQRRRVQPLWQRTLKRIHELERQVQSGIEAELLYDELLHVMKRYLQAQYTLPAEVMTEQEIAAVLDKHIENKDIVHATIILLQDAQRIKYAPNRIGHMIDALSFKERLLYAKNIITVGQQSMK